MIISTPHGDFAISRKGTVAFSVVRCRHAVSQHGKQYQQGDYAPIFHRGKVPKHLADVRGNRGYWCEYVASYDLEGNLLNLGSDGRSVSNDKPTLEG